jgi:hypothetical protein
MSFTIKQGDTRPRVIATLYDNFGGAGQAVINLSTASSVTFLMRAVGSAAGDPPDVEGACSVTNAAGGVVEYTWQPGDTDVIGAYEAEFEIVWADGGVQTVPNASYLSVEVYGDLG